MGMDVYSVDGSEYFRANVWNWPVIMLLTEKVSPWVETSPMRYNDGKGLTPSDCVRLHDDLVRAWHDGSLRAAYDAYEKQRQSIPKVRCELCDGTGTRADKIGVDLGYAQRQWCNGCDGTGSKDDYEAWYSTDWDHVVEWVEFVGKAAQHGGFEVW